MVKMVQIINLDEQILKSVPHVIELLYEIYGPKTIGLFAVVVDNELGFVGRDGGDCVYIHKNGFNQFSLTQEEELGAIRKDDLEIFFGDDVYFVNGDKIEQHVELYALDEPDTDDYDGCVSYKQYNPHNDTLCEIRYQHMYREIGGRPIIYGYHTQKIDCLYIDEEYTKKPRPKKGLLPKRAKYYTKVEFDSDMVGYKLTGIREYGLFDFLEKGPYELQMENNLIRYAKTQLIDADGNFRDFWPLGEQLKPEEIKDLIKSYGFKTVLPGDLIDIYNGRDEIVNTIMEIVKQMKEVSKELKETEESEKFALLRLRTE